MNDRINFSPFQLDLPAGRLLRGTKPIELRPKAFEVLRYLAERPRQLVTKEQLLDAVWKDVHVEESVLKVIIGEIRKALADPSREPRFIETAHRRGYRFVARIEPQVHAAPVHDFPSPASRPVPREPVPETRYARNGDVNIAYQVVGDGPIDLVFVMGWVSNLEYFWKEPSFARFLRRLASFSRLILFDKRGTGLSDRVPVDALPTLEQRMDDVRAVMEAAGSKRAALCGVSEGAAMSALFAATYPEKTSALVMIAPYARRIRTAGYPWGPTEVERERFLDEIREKWGGPVGLEERAPSVAADPRFRQWWATYLRMAASPAAAVALTRMNSEADIRNILPEVRVPTVVIHRTGDKCLMVEEGRYVASRIPGARFVELPGVDHLPFAGDQDAILNEVEEFVTASTQTPVSDDVLATIAAVSFKALRGEPQPRAHVWQRLEHLVSREVARFQGLEFRCDGRRVLASFEGPARAIRCASAIAHHASQSSIQTAAGLHIGECRIKGRKMEGFAVDLARRIEGEADPGEILVSGTIRDLVAGSGIRFQERGSIASAGSPNAVPLLSVDRGLANVGRKEPPQRAA
jgi:pimeloyl-ACP methyl ester carboxylesterase/DNA-binding winged helix-turn-helix (wHTH) protein